MLFVGIIIKYDAMSYKEAVHHAHLVLSLCSKASRYIRDLLDAPDVSCVICINLRYIFYVCSCCRMKLNQLDCAQMSMK